MTVTPIHQVKDLVSRHWDRRSAMFDQEASHGLLNDAQHDAWRSLLEEVVGPGPFDALDVGCGTGFLALLLAELGHCARGIDMAQGMLDQARQKAEVRGLGIDFVQGDAEAPPSNLGRFDLICMRHVIWTLPDPTSATRNWLSLLRPGGRVLLVEGEFKSAGMKDEYVQIAGDLPLLGGRPAAEIAALLESAGFVRTTVRPLMDESLWLEVPKFPRYLITASRT